MDGLKLHVKYEYKVNGEESAGVLSTVVDKEVKQRG